MDKNRMITSDTLKKFGVAAILSGAITLFPSFGSAEISILGYQAICSFSPISTVLLICTCWMAIGLSDKKG